MTGTIEKSSNINAMLATWADVFFKSYALVAADTASFNQGEMTREETVSYCLENIPMKELARVYKLMMEK